MTSKYERSGIQKTIVSIIDRYVEKFTPGKEALINITKAELAKEFEVSLATLNKYLAVYLKSKGFTCKFLDKKSLTH